MLMCCVVFLAQVPVQLVDVNVVHDAVENVPVPAELPSWVVGLYFKNVYQHSQWGFMFGDCVEMKLLLKDVGQLHLEK
jgi:hypothetical protein